MSPLRFSRRSLISIVMAFGLIVPSVGMLSAHADEVGVWTARDSNRLWYGVASSSDGTKLVATDYGGHIYTSTDYGVTWTPRDAARNWYGVASSSDGTKLVATTASEAAGLHSLKMSGNASSNNGANLVVSNGRIYTSTDSGVTWTARDSDRNWRYVASSSDGAKLVAVESGGYIYTSTDSGATWTPRGASRNWWGIASSSDGTKLVATVDGGQIYTSADSGITWTARDVDRNWYGVASSSDGTKLVAASNSDHGATLKSSSDVTQTRRGDSNRDWLDDTPASGGANLVADTGYIYTSTDSGVTWTARSDSNKWYGVASSSDGTKLVAVSYAGTDLDLKASGSWINGVAATGGIYTSTDSGITWTSSNASRNWFAVASSSDGLKVVATVVGGQIYTTSFEPPKEVATITSLTFSADTSGTSGKLHWSGANIDSYLFIGPESTYPSPYNYGAFTAAWDGTLINLVPGQSYEFSIMVRSSGGLGQMMSISVTTKATSTPTPTPTPTPLTPPTSANLKLLGTVYFSAGSSFLNAPARRAIEKMAQNILQSSGRSVVIEGYSNSVGDANNAKLSSWRARTVGNYLRNNYDIKVLTTFGNAPGITETSETGTSDPTLSQCAEVYLSE